MSEDIDIAGLMAVKGDNDPNKAYHTMMDLIREKVKGLLGIKDDFNFSILVEKNPVKKKYTYLCKLLAIIVKDSSMKLHYIHFDKIEEEALNFVDVKENTRR